MRRSPLAEEIERAAALGSADAVAIATRRHQRVRATRLPDVVEVPDLDPHVEGILRAERELVSGGPVFEGGDAP